MEEESWREKLGYRGGAASVKEALSELHQQKRSIEELVADWPSDEIFRRATLDACLGKIDEVEAFMGVTSCDPRVYCDSHDQWGHHCD